MCGCADYPGNRIRLQGTGGAQPRSLILPRPRQLSAVPQLGAGGCCRSISGGSRVPDFAPHSLGSWGSPSPLCPTSVPPQHFVLPLPPPVQRPGLGTEERGAVPRPWGAAGSSPGSAAGESGSFTARGLISYFLSFASPPQTHLLWPLKIQKEKDRVLSPWLSWHQEASPPLCLPVWVPRGAGCQGQPGEGPLGRLWSRPGCSLQIAGVVVWGGVPSAHPDVGTLDLLFRKLAHG